MILSVCVRVKPISHNENFNRLVYTETLQQGFQCYGQRHTIFLDPMDIVLVKREIIMKYITTVFLCGFLWSKIQKCYIHSYTYTYTHIIIIISTDAYEIKVAMTSNYGYSQLQLYDCTTHIGNNTIFNIPWMHSKRIQICIYTITAGIRKERGRRIYHFEVANHTNKANFVLHSHG